MTEDDLNITNVQLLDNLGLITNGKLKCAAVMLFHCNQEKWFSGAYIKIGYFETDADLCHQDEIHGSLLIQADRIIKLIYLKYMKAEISYYNVTRI
jgi:ATP-dependent DNA helicase RecG